MSVKKSPNALSTEELLKQLEEAEKLPKEAPQVITENYPNDTLAFLSVFAIEPGNDLIKRSTLYSIYKVWSKDPISKPDFYIEMEKYLVTISHIKGYKINQNAVKLTHEAYSKFKQEKIRLKSKHWTVHFQDFLDYNGITSGKFWIQDIDLYDIYKYYAKKLGLDKNPKFYMSAHIFGSYCSVFFKSKVTRKGRVYGVSPNIQKFFLNDPFTHLNKKYEKKVKPPRKPKTS